MKHKLQTSESHQTIRAIAAGYAGACAVWWEQIIHRGSFCDFHYPRAVPGAGRGAR